MSKRRCAIKVCGLKEESNVQEVLALSPEYIGHIFYEKSPRYLTDPMTLPLDTETQRVGVFVNASLERIVDEVRNNALSIIQLHGLEPVSLINSLKESLPDIGIWKAIKIKDEFPLELISTYRDAVDSFLFDTYSELGGGSGVQFDHALLDHYTEDTPYLLSGGIGPDDAKLVRELFDGDDRMWGVDINSRFETGPGVKDVRLLSQFIDELRR